MKEKSSNVKTHNNTNNHLNKDSQDTEQPYKPQTTQSSDGTVSCSIEETNKMRAALGLPPLKTNENEKEERKTSDAEEEKSTEADSKSSEVQKRLERAQQRRRERELERVKSLGEASDDEDESALKWIKKSKRKTEQRKKEEMEQKIREEEEMAEKAAQEYSAADLSGMKVLHDKDKFEEGQEFILNLADKSVLDENDDDELENIDISTKDKKEWQNKQKKSAYSVFDDLEQKKQSVLPQYDEENLNRAKESFVLGGESKNSSQLQRVRNKLRKPSSKKEYSIEDNKNSEFKSGIDQSNDDTSELLNKMKKRRKKKKKNLRKKEIESEPLGETIITNNNNNNNNNVASSMDIEHDEDIEDDKDYASRSSRQEGNNDKERLAKMAQKERAFQYAQQKAQDETAAMAEKHHVSLADNDEEVDDTMFYQNLQRMQQRAKSKPKQPENVVLKAVETASNVEKQNQQENQSSLVFDPTSEFCRNISLEEDNTSTLISRRRKPRKKLRKKEIDSEIHEQQNQEEPQGSTTSQEPQDSQVKSMEIDSNNDNNQNHSQSEDKVIDKSSNKENNDEDKTDEIKPEQYQPILEEPLVGSSLTAALDFAKQKGMMGDEYKGRAKDQRPDAEITKTSESKKGPGIVLEHLDDQGQPMTQKEAFRYQSYRFHNIRKSKTKLEKERKKREQELKMKQLTDPNAAVDALRTTQQLTSQPFVTIQGQGTSDLSKAATSVLSETSKKRKAETQAGGKVKRRKK